MSWRRFVAVCWIRSCRSVFVVGQSSLETMLPASMETACFDGASVRKLRKAKNYRDNEVFVVWKFGFFFGGHAGKVHGQGTYYPLPGPA